ncbi:MAG: hypothetical protein ACXQTW_02080 [Candidatus Methanospirareceae archaeon]
MKMVLCSAVLLVLSVLVLAANAKTISVDDNLVEYVEAFDKAKESFILPG